MEVQVYWGWGGVLWSCKCRGGGAMRALDQQVHRGWLGWGEDFAAASAQGLGWGECFGTAGAWGWVGVG